MIKTFTQEYSVRHNETDLTGRMTVPALGDCMLDIAGLHANEIAWGIDKLQRGGLTWVVAGMKFIIHRMPKIDSRFKIDTHVSAYSRISTQRDFVAYDDEGKIAEASTEWLIINMENVGNIRAKINEVLSGLEQEVLNAYLDGKSYQEIAETLGRHVKSIDNALQRVKRKLEKNLEENQT